MAKEKENDILIVDNQECPVCGKKQATFTEYEIEDAFAGPIAIFAIKCNACGFKNQDLEFVNQGDPAEYTLEVTCKADLNIRVIKSGECEVKIPTFRISVDSTMGSEGFISNVEGVIVKFKQQIEFLKGDEELEKEQKKKLKNILKGLDDVLSGEKPMTLKMIDNSGNSAIISDKVVVKKLRRK